MLNDKHHSLISWCEQKRWHEKFEDTKGGQSEGIQRDRQYNGQKLEDTKGVIRRHKRDRQYNGQKLEDKAVMVALNIYIKTYM